MAIKSKSKGRVLAVAMIMASLMVLYIVGHYMMVFILYDFEPAIRLLQQLF